MDCYRILPPAYRSQGAVHTLTPKGDSRFSDDAFEVEQRLEPAQSGLLLIRRTWRNLGPKARAFQPVLSIVTLFTPTHYVIPCVSYNGNAWGAGKEPKGLTYEGRPWVFSHHRTGIPGATLSEDARHAVALFASDGDASSLTCSCSLERLEDGTMRHSLLYPIIEEPLTYCGRDRYGDAYASYVRLEPGETFAATACAFTGTPRRENFGMAGLEDAALDLLHSSISPAIDSEETWSLGIAFAKHLKTEEHGHTLLRIGDRWQEQAYRQRLHYEIGWCGQNALYARMLIRDYEKYGHPDSLRLGLGILDAWASEGVRPSGLIAVHFERRNDPEAQADTCNLGVAAAEFIRAQRALHRVGIERPEYLRAALGVCDFFVRNFSETDGFGKSWSLSTGERTDGGGTVGSYLIPALVEAYRAVHNPVYLETARRALDFYNARDLSRFECMAGALDTVCVDKETSGPLIIGALMLYEETGDAACLRAAEDAAYYFCSWMYHYRAHYARESDFRQYGFDTAGGTAVSVQHHHMDPWGAFVAGWLLRLARHTNNASWRRRAHMLYANATQCVTRAGGPRIHGHDRPLGSQNEAFFQCRWSGEPGDMNDWLVAWPGAFRLYALEMAEELGETYR